MNEDTTQTAGSATPASGGLAAAAKAATAKPKKNKGMAKAAKAKPAKKAKAKKNGAAAQKGPGVLKEYAPKYVKGGGKEGEKAAKTAGGNLTIDNGDKTAAALRGMDIEDVYKHASKITETPVTELKKKYGHLNLGMQRMNLGNRVRGVVNAK